MDDGAAGRTTDGPAPAGERPADLTAYVYDAIRVGILSLRYQPGQALSESALARELGVSRTPAREALRRLQGEGLVASSGSGLIVASLSVADVENAYLLIECLEGLACRLAAERLTDEGALRLRAALDQLTAAGETADLDAWILADSRFHEAIRTLAANPTLAQVAGLVYPLIERVRHMHLREEPAPARIADQTAAHRAIGEAVLAGDGARAEALTRDLFADARVRNARLLRQWVEPLRRQF